MQKLLDSKISIDNIAFGMGGGLLQKCDRDTYGWAMKCSAARVNGEWRDVYKDPISGGKTSKRGLVTPSGFSVDYNFSEYFLHKGSSEQGFITYYRNGVRVPKPTWSDIRKRAEV
jgi:nicotinamide phosphoribosyltransferase